MIEARELRIGNWVIGDIKWDGNDIPFQVNKIEECDYGDLIKPIPLTEEWLVKAGFNYTGGWDDRYRNDFLKIYGSPLKKGWTIENIEPNFEIHHLHQLQNLYFALTGNELTIKL